MHLCHAHLPVVGQQTIQCIATRRALGTQRRVPEVTTSLQGGARTRSLHVLAGLDVQRRHSLDRAHARRAPFRRRVPAHIHRLLQLLDRRLQGLLGQCPSRRKLWAELDLCAARLGRRQHVPAPGSFVGYNHSRIRQLGHGSHTVRLYSVW